MGGRERVDALELLGGVARGHVGHGAQADGLHVLEELVEERVLELLSLLVARRRGGYVAQVGVGGDRADRVGELDDLGRARQLVGGLDVDAIQVVGLQDAQQVVHEVRVVLVGQDAREGGGNLNAHRIQALDQGGAAAKTADQGRGHGSQQVTLGDAAAIGVLGDADHVRLGIEGLQAQVGEDLARALSHGEGALKAGGALGGEPLGDLLAGRRRHALHRHVGHAHGVRVVELTLRERRSLSEAGANLKAGDGTHAQNAGGLTHLGCRADRIVIDRADNAQAVTPRQQRRVGGRVGAKREARVDVVVRLGHPAGEVLVGDHRAQRLDALDRGGGRIVGDVHGFCHLFVGWRKTVMNQECGRGRGSVRRSVAPASLARVRESEPGTGGGPERGTARPQRLRGPRGSGERSRPRSRASWWARGRAAGGCARESRRGSRRPAGRSTTPARGRA